MSGWQDFQGINAGYVAELYERFRRDPGTVDAETRDLFARHGAPATDGAPAPLDATVSARAIVGAVMLADAIRKYGHLQAQVDPLGAPPIGDPTLDPAAHGITDADLEALPASLIGGPAADGAASAREAIARLRKIYCSTTGYDIAQIFVPAEREWLRHAAESRRFWPPTAPIDGAYLLDRITEVEVFERFLQRTFPGKTRFSIEGLDMMIPMLEVIIENAAANGTRHVLLGMAHRGRLNVLAHVMQKPYTQILAEFKDPITKRTAYRIDLGWTGDVKYHWGGRTRLTDDVSGLDVAMAPNPSHLEAVNPVVAGMARAAGTTVDHGGAAEFDPLVTLPLLIHGDAAFPGQGVVAETLNLSRLEGYDTGGTIHIIANNQLGFTATPDEVYSHLVCERPGARVQDSHPARQRRRPGGLRRRCPPGDRLPFDVQPRRPHRSRGLSPPWAQRGRRTGIHAAGALPGRRRASDGARPVRAAADRRGRGHAATPPRRSSSAR